MAKRLGAGGKQCRPPLLWATSLHGQSDGAPTHADLPQWSAAPVLGGRRERGAPVTVPGRDVPSPEMGFDL
jgi:hypothetical protein